MKLLDEHRIGYEIHGRFHADLTKMTNQHLINRLNYFERMLKNRPGEMIYMGDSEYAEEAVDAENAMNEDLAEDIKIHIVDLKEEIKKRGGEIIEDSRSKKIR